MQRKHSPSHTDAAGRLPLLLAVGLFVCLSLFFAGAALRVFPAIPTDTPLHAFVQFLTEDAIPTFLGIG